MAYFDERQNKIILSDDEKNTFKECSQYFQNGRKSQLQFPKLLDQFINLNICKKE